MKALFILLFMIFSYQSNASTCVSCDGGKAGVDAIKESGGPEGSELECDQASDFDASAAVLNGNTKAQAVAATTTDEKKAGN